MLHLESFTANKIKFKSMKQCSIISFNILYFHSHLHLCQNLQMYCQQNSWLNLHSSVHARLALLQLHLFNTQLPLQEHVRSSFILDGDTASAFPVGT